MNKMGKLIKSKTIPFVNTLINNYSKLKLNETEAMLLLLLYNQQEENNQQLLISDLTKKMSLTENELSNVILGLIQKGFIELTIQEDHKEYFNIDNLIDKLGEAIDEDTQENKELERKEQLQIIISYIESSYGRPVNNNDLVIINNWLDLGYSIEDIKEAILDSLKAKKLHLRYADAILASRHKQRETVDEIDEEGAELLASIYVKK